MLPTAKILAITNWCLVYIAILIYLVIFVCLFKLRRELRNIALLLTCHTCLSAFLVCLTVVMMVSSNLFSGFLLYNMKFCNAWGLFYDIFECGIYYSYCLQAIYRLCRIVFYKKRYLLSYSLYLILILVQWLIILTLLLPPVFVNWYTRLPTETFCLIPYTYIGPEVYHILLLYLILLICLATIYIWITRYMRGVSQAPALAIGAAQRVRNQRDLTVIKRILMLISILIVLRFPTIIFMTYGAIVGSLYEFTYGIVGLITSVCLIFIGIITIYITSQLRDQILHIIGHENNRVHTGAIPPNAMNTPVGIIANATITLKSNQQNISLPQRIP